jgi:hypothetical protein
VKRRDLLVGGLVAAVLIAGVLFTRLRHQPAAAGNGPQVDVDLSAGDGQMVIDGATVDIAINPRPARPFEKLQFRFRVTRDGRPVAVEEARVSFNMTMDMGPHDYVLIREGDEWIAREVVLPQCGSGSRLWFGNLELREAGATRAGRFRIELAPLE